MEKADPWKGIKGLLEKLDDNRGSPVNTGRRFGTNLDYRCVNRYQLFVGSSQAKRRVSDVKRFWRHQRVPQEMVFSASPFDSSYLNCENV